MKLAEISTNIQCEFKVHYKSAEAD